MKYFLLLSLLVSLPAFAFPISLKIASGYEKLDSDMTTYSDFNYEEVEIDCNPFGQVYEFENIVDGSLITTSITGYEIFDSCTLFAFYTINKGEQYRLGRMYLNNAEFPETIFWAQPLIRENGVKYTPMFGIKPGP